MAFALSRAEEILSSAKADIASAHTIFSTLSLVAEEIGHYKDAMKAEIDPLFSDSANHKTEDVINTVTELYDDLFNLAKSEGASEHVLQDINRFIDEGMTSLVHNFSEYFDDKVKEMKAFKILLETRANEAIWSSVFTFYFDFSNLNRMPPSLASDFIDRFWDCFLVAENELRLGRRGPYYFERLEKIFSEEIYLSYRGQGGRKEYKNPDYVRLFERCSLAIAEQSSVEKRKAIELDLSVQTFEPPSR